MTVDVKSYELAVHFLSDYTDDQISSGKTRASVQQELAEVIQKAVEDWLADKMIPF